MGDVAMTVPILRALLKLNPELKITIVSRPFFKPIFDDIPNLSFISAKVDGKHKGFFGIKRLTGELAKIEFDAVADLHNVIRSKLICFCLRFRGTKTAVLDKGRSEKKQLTHADGNPIHPLKSTHERYADVFRKLGLNISFENTVSRVRRSFSENVLTIMGDVPEKLIGIAPFAAYCSKTYPSTLMKEVIDELSREQNTKIVLFGGGVSEIEKLENVSSKYSNVLNVAGKLTFNDELILISNLDVMLAMDSGNGHLAANFGVPVVTLWGVTHPFAGFTPYLQPAENQFLSDRTKYPLIPTSIYGNKFPDGYEKAMETISPKKVINRMKQILNQTSS